MADWDTMRSKIYAKRAIRFVLSVNPERLPKETTIAFPLPDGSEDSDLPYIRMISGASFTLLLLTMRV